MEKKVASQQTEKGKEEEDLLDWKMKFSIYGIFFKTIASRLVVQ